jgi:hypothetical protein
MAELMSEWPGEREPAQLDVEKAYERLDPTVQRDFKRALFDRGIAQDYGYTQQSRFVDSFSPPPDDVLQGTTDDSVRLFFLPLF